MWPFKSNEYAAEAKLRLRKLESARDKVITCQTCGHLVAANRAVEVTVFGYSHGNGPTKEYYCEEDAPQWRVISYGIGVSGADATIRYRDRIQRIEYGENGKVLSRKYTS